jgi:type I restriction enzyme S subunit
MKIPEIRFPEFSGEWVEKRLGEIGEIKYGKGQNEITNKGGIYPIIGTGGILGNSGEYLYDKESVILGRKGTIDKPIYINKPFWCVDTTYYFKFYKAYLSKFIFYLLNKINWKMYNESTGVPSLSSNTIKKIKIHIPPTLTEQEKIAEFLSSIDEKIEITAKKIEKLKDYKKGLLQKMLNVINGEPEIRFKEFSGKWLEKRLGELIEERNEKTTINNQYPVLTSSKKGIFFQEEYFSKQTASENNIGYKIVYFGDFTYRSMSDTGQFTFNIQNLIEKGIVSPAYPVFKVIKEKANALFVYYSLNNSIHIKKQILILRQGGTRLALNFNKLKQLKIYIPSTLEEQQKIANFLSSVDEKIEITAKKIEKLKDYKKGLLQKMLNVINGEPEIRFKKFSGKWVEKKLGDLIKIQNGYAFKSDKFKNKGIPIIRISNISIITRFRKN